MLRKPVNCDNWENFNFEIESHFHQVYNSRTTPQVLIPTPKTVTMSSSNAAMNIMEKYQSLNRDIEEARRQTTGFMEDKENLELKAFQLAQEIKNMKHDIEKSEKDKEYWQASLQSALKSGGEDNPLESSSIALSTNRQEHQHQQRIVAFLEDHAEEQSRTFCEESRTFRANVKRLHLTSSECGLASATRHAFLLIHGVAEAADAYLEADSLSGISSIEKSKTELEEEWHNEALAATAKSNEDTPYHHAAMLCYQRTFEEFEKSEKAYQERCKALEDCKQRASLRTQKKQSLQAQLARLRTKIQEMELELADICEQTKEIEAITKSYQQRIQVVPSVSQKNDAYPLDSAHSITCVPSSNPYTRSSNQGSQTQQKEQQQFPHLVGRTRLDRRFGGPSIGLSIRDGHQTGPTVNTTLGDIEDSDDDISDFVPFQRSSANK
jgi:septal ring factor EnvC (AmiA/AmiB activator)